MYVLSIRQTEAVVEWSDKSVVAKGRQGVLCERLSPQKIAEYETEIEEMGECRN